MLSVWENVPDSGQIVRIPYLYSGVYKEDYFYKMFAAIRSGEPVEIQESPDQHSSFVTPWIWQNFGENE